MGQLRPKKSAVINVLLMISKKAGKLTPPNVKGGLEASAVVISWKLIFVAPIKTRIEIPQCVFTHSQNPNSVTSKLITFAIWQPLFGLL